MPFLDRGPSLTLLAGLVLAAVTVGVLLWAGASTPRPPRTLLLTGFGPFGDFPSNPAWECALRLDGHVVGDHVIRIRQIEVAYASAAPQLAAAIRDTQPDTVVCLGVAAGDHLRLETLARNEDRCAQPDVTGVVRDGVPIRPGGADLLPSRLPLGAIREHLDSAGYEVAFSEDAGGYLCNHVFYQLVATWPEDAPGGFVHVPSLEGPWTLDRLVAAVRLVLETVVNESGAPRSR